MRIKQQKVVFATFRPDQKFVLINSVDYSIMLRPTGMNGMQLYDST